MRHWRGGVTHQQVLWQNTPRLEDFWSFIRELVDKQWNGKPRFKCYSRQTMEENLVSGFQLQLTSQPKSLCTPWAQEKLHLHPLKWKQKNTSVKRRKRSQQRTTVQENSQASTLQKQLLLKYLKYQFLQLHQPRLVRFSGCLWTFLPFLRLYSFASLNCSSY